VLRERSNEYESTTLLGMRRLYTDAACLVTPCYVAYLLAAMVEEVAGLVEGGAPTKYVADAKMKRLRSLAVTVPQTMGC
jgi:hypothetical protein